MMGLYPRPQRKYCGQFRHGPLGCDEQQSRTAPTLLIADLDRTFCSLLSANRPVCTALQTVNQQTQDSCFMLHRVIAFLLTACKQGLHAEDAQVARWGSHAHWRGYFVRHCTLAATNK